MKIVTEVDKQYQPSSLEVVLSKGQNALISPEDADRVQPFKWYLNASGYAARRIGYKQKSMVYMHRLIMDAPAGYEVDHINGNKLDNRRENLRLVTRQQNMHNRPARRKENRTSIYKGVYKHVDGNYVRWAAQILVEKKKRHLGLFNTEVEAACAYDRAASDFQGEYARLNFPEVAR